MSLHPSHHAAIRHEICRVGKSLFDRGYVHSTAGNISVRLDDEQGFLITPTDACLGFLDPESLAWIGLDGVSLGGGTASKTLGLHRRIYDADPDTACVLHTHSTGLVTASLAGPWRPDDFLPPITPYFVMKVGHVRPIAYRRPGDPATADELASVLRAGAASKQPIRAVMLERLGPVVWHRTPALAMSTLEELEETARLWVATNRQAEPLAEHQLEELRATFGCAW